MNNDEINTNTEYISEDELNQIVGKDGEAIDLIEQVQEEDAKNALKAGIIGDDDNQQDEILDK